MKKNKTLLGVVLVAGILMLGIGYSAITAIDLKVSGTASGKGDQNNFKVAFDANQEIALTQPATGHGSIAASYTDPVTEDTNKTTLNASVTVTDLTTIGDTASATYTIKNYSADLATDLAFGTPTVGKNADSDGYFKVTYEFVDGKDHLAHGESTQVKVTVKLLKTPITDDHAVDIEVPITATPAAGETLAN